MIGLSTARRARRALRAVARLGTRHECTCCGWQFRELLSTGVVPRPNARCPWCHSLERHRLEALFLRERRAELFPAPARLLHFAPERALAPVLADLPVAEYVDADVEPGRAAHCVDVTAIPFGDGSFDAVLCNHVLEHVPDDRLAMTEVLRVLRPGGWALLQVPIGKDLERTDEDPGLTDPAERCRRFGQADHVRTYSACDYPQRLADAGFEVEAIDFARGLGRERAERHRIDADETIWLCRKARA